MQGLAGFAWLLGLQTIGELLARGLSLPVPGPVIGMVLLVTVLAWQPARASIGVAADLLLSHLSLLFVPVAVGVISYLPLLREYAGRLALVLVLSTWIGLVVTVSLLRWLEKGDDAPAR
jgi:putative effector of murein hydrolase LrgA (UPF0299 family)